MTDTPTYLRPPHEGVSYLVTQQIPTVVRLAQDVAPDGMPAIFDEIDRRNCVAWEEGEELWDVQADLTAWHEPRGRASSTRSARRMRMDEETFAARQAELAARTAERCAR